MAGSDKTSGDGATGSTPEQAEAAAGDTSGEKPAGDQPAGDPAGDQGGKTDQKTDQKPDQKPEKKAEKKPGKKAEKKPEKSGKDKPTINVTPAMIRTRVAQLIWLLCVVAALFLALGALVIALDLNQSNAAVDFVLSGAERVDLGIFTLTDGIKEFSGSNAATKNALVNYGIGAVVWIVAGRVADRIIRP